MIEYPCPTKPESTAAAAFQPLRRRVQAVVDRRFNRRRYNAARIIEGFATRLRDQVDLDALHSELLAVGRPDHAAHASVALAAVASHFDHRSRTRR